MPTTGDGGLTAPPPAPEQPTSTAVVTTSGDGEAPATTPAPDTDAATDPVRYVVVAEERARRLTVLDVSEPCVREPGACEVGPIVAVDLPAGPHNLAARGSVVFATHPHAGTVSRVDLADGSSSTVSVGTEPHDVKYSALDGVLFVADEDGSRLLTVDPTTLEVIDELDLPARPHDLAVAGDTVWVTMIGRDELAAVSNGAFVLHSTGGSPHDLIVDDEGLVWFSNWNADDLSVFDPLTGDTVTTAVGVSEPHHFALADDGTLWVSDNGGAAVVRVGEQPTAVEVGPTPHHLAVVDDLVVVAVSGTGRAVFVHAGIVSGHAELSTGLHGVAVVEVAEPLSS